MSIDRQDAGQVLPFAALTLALAAALLLLLGRAGGMLVSHAQARTAADAAALAGVLGGRSAAVDVARANNGELVEYERDGAAVEVRVRVGPAVAVARAERRVAEDVRRAGIPR